MVYRRDLHFAITSNTHRSSRLTWKIYRAVKSQTTIKSFSRAHQRRDKRLKCLISVHEKKTREKSIFGIHQKRGCVLSVWRVNKWQIIVNILLFFSATVKLRQQQLVWASGHIFRRQTTRHDRISADCCLQIETLKALDNASSLDIHATCNALFIIIIFIFYHFADVLIILNDSSRLDVNVTQLRNFRFQSQIISSEFKCGELWFSLVFIGVLK